jgi:hypothetical protein
MTDLLSPKLRELIADNSTVKIVATVDGDGRPHAVLKASLHVADDGRLHYLEKIETSATNRNLLRALWFGGGVAIALVAPDGRSVQIKGRPIKIHITGPLFLRHYQELRARDGDADLAAVWVIEPDEVIDQDLAARRAEEEARHPSFVHLDRLAV